MIDERNNQRLVVVSGGGGGMNPGNMGKMLQKMQADMLAAQQALETETVEVAGTASPS